MPLMAHGGRLLTSSGVLAAGANCCCSDIPCNFECAQSATLDLMGGNGFTCRREGLFVTTTNEYTWDNLNTSFNTTDITVGGIGSAWVIARFHLGSQGSVSDKGLLLQTTTYEYTGGVPTSTEEFYCYSLETSMYCSYPVAGLCMGPDIISTVGSGWVKMCVQRFANGVYAPIGGATGYPNCNGYFGSTSLFFPEPSFANCIYGDVGPGCDIPVTSGPFGPDLLPGGFVCDHDPDPTTHEKLVSNGYATLTINS